MPHPLVLRLPRTDVVNDFVLVNVQQFGPSSLDLKLVATDGQVPFVAHIQQKAIHSLQSSNSHLDPQQWQSILSLILLQSFPHDAVSTDVEASAQVSSSLLTITIRRNISGITQHLGAINLDKDEDESIELFDWTGIAVSRADALADQLTGLQSTVTDYQKKIAELTTQLDGLVQAKKTHQDELLRKFAALLNTKKLKIRDQQRLLAHAKVDPKAATQVHQARSAAGHKPDLSRSSKRKANDSINESETDDDDFEGTDLGNRMDEEDDMRQELDQPLSTPDKSDLDTEDEDSDAGFAPAPVPSQSSRSGISIGTRGKALETVKPNEVNTAPKETGTQQLPPRRQLPFAKKTEQALSSQAPPKSSSTVASSKPPPTMDDDDETDDEL